MTTEERLTAVEEKVDLLITLNQNVVTLIELNHQRIEQNRLKIEHNERQIEQTQRLWIAVAKHYGLLDDIDFDPDDLEPNN